MSYIFTQGIDKIDSFESTYKNVLFRNNNLVIPYINLQVPKWMLNENGEERTFLSYSYVVFKNVTFLTIFIEGLKRYTVIDRYKQENLFYFGGNYLDYNDKIFNDIQISCSEAFLQILSITSFSNIMWKVLEKSEEHFCDLDETTTDNFWNHKLIPNNIMELLH